MVASAAASSEREERNAVALQRPRWLVLRFLRQAAERYELRKM